MNTIIKLIQIYMAAVWMIALIITSPIWITAVIIEELEAELIELRKI